jgi:prolyl oligopeptidase
MSLLTGVPSAPLCRLASAAALAGIALTAFQSVTADSADRGLSYPAARKGDVVEEYHGTRVPDPYRWMESLDAPEVARWVAASNEVTERYVAGLPLREPFRARLTEL